MLTIYKFVFILCTAYLREVDQQKEFVVRNDTDPAVKRRALMKIQQALIAAQEIGDEKLQIVQQVQDLIENKARQLDLDFRNLGRDYPTFLSILLISVCTEFGT